MPGSDRVVPTEPGWWLASWEGGAPGPLNVSWVRADLVVRHGQWLRTPVTDTRWTWHRPVDLRPEPRPRVRWADQGDGTAIPYVVVSGRRHALCLPLLLDEDAGAWAADLHAAGFDVADLPEEAHDATE